MAVFIARRLIGLIAVLFAITVLTFLIFFATPGVDPTRALAGRNPTPETVAAIKHQFGLDRSLPMQYLLMMKRLFISRDLVSYGNQALKDVPAITAAAPVTFSLVIGAAVIWVVLSILAGLLDVLDEDHVGTARAKSISERSVLLKHVPRMTIISFVRPFGLAFGMLV